MRPYNRLRHPAILLTGMIAFVGPFGCTFDLADVEGTTLDAGAPDVHVDALAQDASCDESSGQDVAEEDVTTEVQQVDGCWPPTDGELCSSHGSECGVLDTTDECGQVRSVVCGTCSLDAHCEQGTCVSFGYAWKTGAWSACSEPCDGGTQTRTVWCERDDGLVVDDSECSGSKPSASTSCNTTACHPPTGPVIVDTPVISYTQIGLSWQPVADATEYTVLWSSVLGDGVDSTTNTWYIIDTDTSYEHWISIYPCNSAGCGSPAQFGPIQK